MTRPGTTITLSETPPPRSAPTDTSTWFVAGLTEKGPIAPTEIKSLTQFTSVFGSRVTYGQLYDAADVFFHEGGNKMVVGRVLGPTPVKATCNLYDASGSTPPGDTSLIVTAKEYGLFRNTLNAAVIAPLSSGYRIQITDDTDATLIETSPDLTSAADAISWSAVTSLYVDITAGTHSSENPRVQGPTSLATGDDDRANITDDEWADVLETFLPSLGPGQVSMCGRTTTQAYTDTELHAANNNRVALLDGADTATAATLETAGSAMQARTNGRWAGLFAPWAVVPGVTVGTTRTVPYSAVEAGIIARNDGAGLEPNVAAAGENGKSRYALSLTQHYTDAERETLNGTGVNIAREMLGGVRTYGFRSGANPTTLPQWLDLGNVRMVTKIAELADNISEQFLFAQLDGQGHKIAEFGGALRGMLAPFWADGSLYGDTPEEAFNVDVSSAVNTPTTLANNELHATIAMRMSPMAELVALEIVKVGITEAVS